MKTKLLLLICVLPLLSTGCIYKMPTDDDLCTSPHINNPQLTGERAPSLFPTKG